MENSTLQKQYAESVTSTFNDIIRIATCERNAFIHDQNRTRLRRHLEGLRVTICEQLVELDVIETLEAPSTTLKYEVYRRNGTIIDKGHGTLEQCQQWAEAILQCELAAWSYKIFNSKGECVLTR